MRCRAWEEHTDRERRPHERGVCRKLHPSHFARQLREFGDAESIIEEHETLPMVDDD
jgi:hypothetical protein